MPKGPKGEKRPAGVIGNAVHGKLLTAKRVQMLSMLCEGASMRSVSRVADVCSPAR